MPKPNPKCQRGFRRHGVEQKKAARRAIRAPEAQQLTGVRSGCCDRSARSNVGRLRFHTPQVGWVKPTETAGDVTSRVSENPPKSPRT